MNIFVKTITLALSTSFMVACSSNPKVETPSEPIARAEIKPLNITQTSRGPMVTLNDVLFDFEEASLRPEAAGIIQQAAEYLRNNPERIAVVEGHTDHTGDADYNQMLSEARSKTVTDALQRNGLSERRIQYQGFGETQPVADNLTPAGRQANRRVEIIFQSRGI